MTTIAVALALAGGWLLWNRSRRGKRLMPEAQVRLEFDDTRIVCWYPDGAFQEVAWGNITEIRIRTTSDGPWLPDVYLGIHAASPSPAIVFPQGATGEPALLEALQRRLRGFEDRELIRAMGCTADRTFVLWSAKEPPASGPVGAPPRGSRVT